MTAPRHARAIALGLITAFSPVLMSCKTTRLAQGIIDLNTNQAVFVNAWGLPDRQRVQNTEEFTAAGWSGWSGSLFKGKTALSVWVYESRKTELVFDTQNRLVAFKTDLSREELQATYIKKQGSSTLPVGERDW